MTFSRRIVAEGLGTALLLCAVVGSGIMGERLAAGNVALALLANTLATGAALVVLILTFGPISGAHFNPAVTLATAWQGGLRWHEVPAYVAAQFGGALVGVLAAHLMFGEAWFQLSQHARAGGSQLLSEFVATFGLLSVIWGCGRQRAESVPMAVGLYITSAYWFTASTSFANPAVTRFALMWRTVRCDAPATPTSVGRFVSSPPATFGRTGCRRPDAPDASGACVRSVPL